MNALLEPVAQRYRGLGLSVIPTKPRSKAGAVPWKPYQRQRADEELIHQWFADTDSSQLGVAIVLGRISGGLLVRDFDERGAYEAWKADRRALARSLPTVVTKRGFHVYGRCEDYGTPVKFVHHFGDGELRGDGHIVVAPPSLHSKTGRPYRWAIEPKESIPLVSISDFGYTPKPGCVTQDMSVLHGAGFPASVVEAVLATLPDGPGQRNRQLFEFIRRLKGIEAFASKKPDDLLPFVRGWFDTALPAIGTKDFDETRKDFLRGWSLVKFVGGSGSIGEAMSRAQSEPLPPEADRYRVPEVKLLVGLCYQLQVQRGKRAFYLSCRDAAEQLGLRGLRPHVRAWRMLKLLCETGTIQLVEQGSQVARKANEYRYLRCTSVRLGTTTVTATGIAREGTNG